MLRSRLRLVFLAAAALSFDAVAAPPCPAANDAGQAIAAPRAVLRDAIANNDLDTDLAPATSDAIVLIKQRLAALVDAQVACAAPDATNATALEAALGSAVGGADDDAASLAFGVKAFDGARLGVVADVGIPCGSDALWLVYAADGTRWRRVLTATSPRYARIDKAWGSFQAALSPPEADGRWFAALAHVRPWCTSTWSTIDYAVLRPGANADAPQVVVEGSDGIWWGGDDLGRLTVDRTHVELRFHGASIDSGVHNREFVRRYAIDGTTARRVAPFAASPRDFVEEWIVTPWTQARAWATHAAALEAAHAALHAARKKFEPMEFGATTACEDGATQVELKLGDGEQSAYVRVAGKRDWTIAAVGDEADARCATPVGEEPATP